MKHCIFVKFKTDFDWKNELPKIKELFDSIIIEGVHFTEYFTNCIDRENRYDLLIRIDMDKSSLCLYDECENHHKWKETYSSLIEKKAIFDYE